jgi:hypothetical protein
VLAVVGAQLALLERGVELDLVDRGQLAGGGLQRLEVRGLEVRDADLAYEPRGAQL